MIFFAGPAASGRVMILFRGAGGQRTCYDLFRGAAAAPKVNCNLFLAPHICFAFPLCQDPLIHFSRGRRPADACGFSFRAASSQRTRVSFNFARPARSGRGMVSTSRARRPADTV